MKLDINDEVVFKWLGLVKVGIISKIETNNKYFVKFGNIVYPDLGIDTNHNRFGRILSKETEKYKNGELNMSVDTERSKLDIKLAEIDEIFDDIKSLHGTSNGVELRKKIVLMKNELTTYRKMSLNEKGTSTNN